MDSGWAAAAAGAHHRPHRRPARPSPRSANCATTANANWTDRGLPAADRLHGRAGDRGAALQARCDRRESGFRSRVSRRLDESRHRSRRLPRGRGDAAIPRAYLGADPRKAASPNISCWPNTPIRSRGCGTNCARRSRCAGTRWARTSVARSSTLAMRGKRHIDSGAWDREYAALERDPRPLADAGDR